MLYCILLALSLILLISGIRAVRRSRKEWSHEWGLPVCFLGSIFSFLVVIAGIGVYSGGFDQCVKYEEYKLPQPFAGAYMNRFETNTIFTVRDIIGEITTFEKEKEKVIEINRVLKMSRNADFWESIYIYDWPDYPPLDTVFISAYINSLYDLEL
jgi:hypothetical protein